MKKLLILSFFTFSFPFFNYAQTYTISTIAGNGVYNYSGDGGQATLAELYLPQGVAVDRLGNIYIADNYNERIRMVNTVGIITTVAGNGYGAPSGGGFSGDGGQATNAEIHSPYGVVVDTNGNIYFADQENNRIRMVNTGGIISTIAGNGVSGYSGDGGQSTAAELNLPTRVVWDKSGNFYITDEWNNVVRKVNSGGIISTVAGNYSLGGGYNGDGIAATTAQLYAPNGIAIASNGDMYIADYANYRIRMVNSVGIISTVAGIGATGYSGDGGQATAAEISGARDVMLDGLGNLFIAEELNSVIRMVNTSGVISPIAGNFAYGQGFSGDGGPATAAELTDPWALTIDKSGNIYIADWNNERIRKLTSLTTSIDEITSSNENITTYPNPSCGKFTFLVNNGLGRESQVEIKIYNVLGENVYSSRFNPVGPLSVDMSNNSSGIYLYKVIGVDGRLIGSGKLLIQK